MLFRIVRVLLNVLGVILKLLVGLMGLIWLMWLLHVVMHLTSAIFFDPAIFFASQAFKVVLAVVSFATIFHPLSERVASMYIASVVLAVPARLGQQIAAGHTTRVSPTTRHVGLLVVKTTSEGTRVCNTKLAVFVCDSSTISLSALFGC